jgi:5-aminolevulinate synthase
MNQMGSNVFRKASLELQEDVQEMHAVRKGNRQGVNWQVG